MADTQITTKVFILGSGTDVTPPTATDIANITAAFAAWSHGTTIDDLLTSRWDIRMRTPAQMKLHNETLSDGSAAWGYSHPSTRVSTINNTLGPNQAGYTANHEVGGHAVDNDKMNGPKRATVAALMTPSVDTSVSGYWGNGAYKSEPSECFGDTAPRAWADWDEPNALVGYYGRQIDDSNLGAYRTAVLSAGAPASTTLAANASVGATNIKVVATTGIDVGDWLVIGSGANPDVVQVTVVGTAGSGGTGVTITPALAVLHNSGATVTETTPPPGGIGTQQDIIVQQVLQSNSMVLYDITGLQPGTTGTVKIRVYDGKAWSPWSDDVAVATPAWYAGLFSAELGTLTPNLGISLLGPAQLPGSAWNVGIWHYYLWVEQATPSGTILKWSTDADTAALGTLPRRLEIQYQGDPLAWSQKYTVRWELKYGYLTAAGLTDLGLTLLGWTASGMAELAFTPTQDTGPLITYNGDLVDTSFKVDELTPVFVVTARDSNPIDQVQFRVYADDGTTILWDSGIIAFSAASNYSVTVPAGYLSWGMNPKVSAAVREAGLSSLGTFSDLLQFHLNLSPGAPFPVTIQNNSGQVVQRNSDNTWVSSNDHPIVTFPFVDADVTAGYTTEAPTRREIELRDLNNNHVGASPYIRTSNITNTFTIPTGVLVADQIYKIRCRYDDSAGVRGPFSDYVQIMYSTPPTLVSVSPLDGIVENDPTPVFSWVYTSGKPQASYRLIVTADGEQVYDTGLALGVASTIKLPAHLLDTGQNVSWQLTVYDIDGLYMQVIRSFTTAFTQPAAITGLNVVPDIDNKALIVSWDQSTDPAFDSYFVYLRYVRTGDTQYRLAFTITDPTITSIYVRAAAHNLETIIRVTQSNGWMESDSAEASATLGADTDYILGYWLVTPDTVFEVDGVTAHSGDTADDLEVFDPPLGDEKVILNWGPKGFEGHISLYTHNRDMVRIIRSYKQAGTVAILKTWYGAVRYVRITACPDSDQAYGWFNQDISYIEVSPDNVSF